MNSMNRFSDEPNERQYLIPNQRKKSSRKDEKKKKKRQEANDEQAYEKWENSGENWIGHNGNCVLEKKWRKYKNEMVLNFLAYHQ